MEIREVTYMAIALRITVAAIMGGLMGLERGMKNRAAGLRTYMLVCIGSCVIMLTNQFIFQTYGVGDPVRMGAQVISGIGFLGAGTIIVTRRSQIKGLTTAAGLWASAGIGLAVGIGFYEGAIMGALAVVVAMTLLQRMDNRMHSKSKSMDVYIELSAQARLSDLLQQVRSMEIEIHDIVKETGTEDEHSIRAYTATLKVQKRTAHTELLEKLLAIDGVIYAESLN
jgi:putative Mg2+ transporter-C (MgtC) family protein